MVDNYPDFHYQNYPLSAFFKELQINERATENSAVNEGATGKIQGRQTASEPGTNETL
jgi:hypothetical protein